MKMDEKATIKQSKNAYNQWKDIWQANAKHHSKFKMKSLRDFENVGVGRSILCVANGFSFEENIEEIKKNKDNCDILCCDKTLMHLLEHGIEPTYCFVADANVNYEKYMEPVKDKLQNTTLFVSVCANTKWADNGNWKDMYFTVNKDSINSEVEFQGLSGCPNVIPAATNVSNQMLVLLVQSDNEGRKNFFGYDVMGLIGYDYSWMPNSGYYSFDSTGDGKYNYMRHLYLVNRNMKDCYTSNNLYFSASWLDKYLKTFNMPVVQCSKNTVLSTPRIASLDKVMNYKYKEDDKEVVFKILEEKNKALEFISKVDNKLKMIGKDHFYQYIARV